tara:strand:- start:3815 stop:4033 length:219 start_codon:yes stop_codon:yes gene_type:complete
MNRSQSPGSYPKISNLPTLQEYQYFFPHSEWIVCENHNCNKVIRKMNINYYQIVSKYLCGEHGWLYADNDSY